MRLILPVIACLTLGSGVAIAADNFVPPGYMRSLNSQTEPDPDSPSAEIMRRADELQTEIYVKQRQQHRWNNMKNTFKNSHTLNGTDFSAHD